MSIPERGEYSGVAGFVLRIYPFGERSQIVDLFTATLGRVRATAHCSSKNTSPLKAVLQPFVPLLLGLKEGRSDLMNLRSAAVSGRPFRLPLPGYFCASYMNELLFYLYRAREPAPQLFASCLKLLEALSGGAQDIRAEPPLRAFETALLEALGCSINYCLQDGRRLQPGLAYRLSPEDGFVPCFPEDPLGTAGGNCFDGGTLIELARGESRTPAAAAALKRLNRILLDRLLSGRELQSRRMYLEFVKNR